MNGGSSTLRPPMDATLRDSLGIAHRLQLHDLILAEWRRTASPDLVRVLDEHPQVLRDPSLLLDLALEEYKTLNSQSPHLDLGRHCERFHRFGSSIERSVFRQLETQKYLDDHPELLELFRDPQWPELGDEFGRYTVLEELGRGGIARVYLCRECDIGNREVVVKATPVEGVEASVLGRLDHIGIIPIHSSGRVAERNLSYICMPFRGRSTVVDLLDFAFENGIPQSGALAHKAGRRWGEPTATATKSRWRGAVHWFGPPSYIDCVLELAMNLAAALEHAHAQGIVHGDLKPSNILLTSTGRPVLLDFNLSRGAFMSPGLRGGTLPYMPPEHLKRIADLDSETYQLAAEIDHRSDIYSFGVVLFELLTGAPPVVIENRPSNSSLAAQLLLDELRTASLSVRARNRFVSKKLEDLVLRCLKLDPDQRPSTVGEVSRELFEESKLAANLRRRAKSKPILTGILGTLLLTICALLIAFVAMRPPRFEREYHHGLQALTAGENGDAARRLRNSVLENPDFRPARFELGRALLYLGEINAAIEEFGVLARDRSDVKSLAYLGYCFNLNRIPSAAIYWYQQIPDSTNILAVQNNLGAAYLAAPDRLPNGNRFAEPETCLLAALAVNPTSPIAGLNFIRLELAKARADASYNPIKALPYVTVVMKTFPNELLVSQFISEWYVLATERSINVHDATQVTTAATLDHIEQLLDSEIERYRAIGNAIEGIFRFQSVDNSKNAQRFYYLEPSDL